MSLVGWGRGFRGLRGVDGVLVYAEAVRGKVRISQALTRHEDVRSVRMASVQMNIVIVFTDLYC
jgi:hypothetical protein